MPAPAKKDQKHDTLALKELIRSNEEERVMKSWLSTETATLHTDSPAVDEIDDDDFEADEDTSGLGYVAPKETAPHNRQSLSTNDKLRKLLEIDTRQKRTQTRGPGQKSAGFPASKPKPRLERSVEVVDDTEGRTSTMTKKSGKRSAAQNVSSQVQVTDNGLTTQTRPNKRSTNYLDELLAQRRSKRRKDQKD